MINVFNKINQQISLANNILIISHQNPDSDALGSALAMFDYIKRLGKKVSVFTPDLPPGYFDFLPGVEIITSDRLALNYPWDLIIILDTGDFKRAGVGASDFGGALIINIDHHFSNYKFGDINYVDDLASSTCEIIYNFFQHIKLDINKNIATCLLCGILGDTGGFSNAATTIDSMKISSDLINKGAKIYRINNQVIKNKTINGLRLWGDVLSRLYYDSDSEIVFTYIKEEEYQRYQVEEEELDGLVNFLNVIADAKIATLFKINKDSTKVSMRTKRDDIDLSKIAGFYGGGGHKKASGFTLDHAVDEKTDNLAGYLKNENY